MEATNGSRNIRIGTNKVCRLQDTRWAWDIKSCLEQGASIIPRLLTGSEITQLTVDIHHVGNKALGGSMTSRVV